MIKTKTFCLTVGGCVVLVLAVVTAICVFRPSSKDTAQIQQPQLKDKVAVEAKTKPKPAQPAKTPPESKLSTSVT